MKSMRITSNSFTSKKPNNFRVVIKNKSGFLQDSVDASKYYAIKQSKSNNKSIGGLKSDIKQYVKQMKNKNVQEHQKNNNDDNKSVCSLQSDKNSQITLSRALSINQNMLQHKKSEIPKPAYVSIQQLQKRVDYLINLKFSNLQQKTNKDTKNINSINKQLDQIVSILKNANELQENQQKLEVVNRRIYLLQKIMAEGMAQSDIAKKSFYKIISNKKPQKYRLNHYKYDLKMLKQKNTKDLLNQSSPVPIYSQSLNQISYKKPDKKSYPSKPNKSTYQFRNQPIHRSTYGRDFLVFGNVPYFPYKQISSQLMPSYSFGNRNSNSNYQSQFTSKKIQKINFKQLDCYKDKIKTFNIPYSKPKRTQIQTMRNPEQNKQIKEAVQQLNKTVRHKTQQSHYIRNLRTESRLNYTGENNKIISLIKNKNLNDLRYAFKSAVHA